MTLLENIKSASTYSSGRLQLIERAIEDKFGARDDISIIIVGSFARREASEHSDLDYYILTKEIDPPAGQHDDVIEFITQLASQLNIKAPAKNGAFAACVSAHTITGQIGGLEDTNENLTRRMLFLFESHCVFNKPMYEEMFVSLIKCYVKELITQHQLCRFLLNDLIRYYRTICVDFEHKTGADGKSWGDRNIKLMFSRKLLYFSGILVVAETAQRSFESKRLILSKYLHMSPLERVETICGASAQNAFRKYDDFLGKLSDKKWRDLLVATGEVRKEHHEEFRDFKNSGHHFSWDLSLLLAQTYDISHPIHQALRF